MTEKQIGIIGTSVFHLIILLILLFFLIYTPVPISSGGGILIDFGDAETAGGAFEPVVNEQPETQPAVADIEDKEDIMTQDFEEAPAIEKKAEVKKPDIKPAETKPRVTEKPKETTPVIDKNAIYKGKGKATQGENTSQGTYKGPGNQGKPDGVVGGGTDGNGSGTGSGTGLGIQVGGGLENRKILALPKPEFRIQEDGIVVVQVTVNRDGKVISADPGKKGSTTMVSELLAAAKKAALQSKFAVDANLKEFQTQTGTITYHFKLE
jgi:colicin import membrane protein